jgi:hypothetical protein
MSASMLPPTAATGALLSLTATRHDTTIALIAIYVFVAMATLDAYYLATERA